MMEGKEPQLASDAYGPQDFYEFMDQLPYRQHAKGRYQGDEWLSDRGTVNVYRDSITCEVRVEDGDNTTQYRWDPRFDGVMTIRSQGPDGVVTRDDTPDDWLEVKNLLDTWLDVKLVEIQTDIDDLLQGVQAISDGTNMNTFASVENQNGVDLGISKSEKPDGKVGYHASLRLPDDADGYIRTTDIHWGDRDPKVSFTNIHRSRRFNSNWHEDDSHDQRALTRADCPSIERIVAEYRRASTDDGEA